jgi:hypothetical protein
VSSPPDSTCPTCGRTTVSRRTSEPDGDEAGRCPDACCGTEPDQVDLALEQQVLRLLSSRASGATICPSEAARAVGGEHWRQLMEPARAAARRLVARGEVEITQRGRVVDGSTLRGPVRIRRTAPPPSTGTEV